jgi:hypothetical protein
MSRALQVSDESKLCKQLHEWWSACKICWQRSFFIRWPMRNWPILQILKT